MEDTLGFSSGDIVSGLEPSEVVEVKNISPFGKRFLIEGIGVQSRRQIKEGKGDVGSKTNIY